MFKQDMTCLHHSAIYFLNSPNYLCPSQCINRWPSIYFWPHQVLLKWNRNDNSTMFLLQHLIWNSRMAIAQPCCPTSDHSRGFHIILQGSKLILLFPRSSRWGINYVLLEVKLKNNDYCMSSHLKQGSLDGSEVLQSLTPLTQIIS